MNRLVVIFIFGIFCFLIHSCTDDPIGDDGRLITDREESYMSSFNLFGPDHRSVLVGGAVTVNVDEGQTNITAVARFGTNLKHLKPFCSVVTDASVEPAMGVWTDFTQPRRYTVVSGNRKVRKEYTITITLQGE